MFVDFSSEQKAPSNSLSPSPEKTFASARLASKHGSLPSLALPSAAACDTAPDASSRRGRHTRHASLQNERERLLLSTILEDAWSNAAAASASSATNATMSTTFERAKPLPLSWRAPTRSSESNASATATSSADARRRPHTTPLPDPRPAPAVRPDFLSAASAHNRDEACASHHKVPLLCNSTTADQHHLTPNVTPSQTSATDTSQQSSSGRLFVPTHKRSHTATSIDSDISDEFSVAVPQHLLFRGVALQLQADSEQPAAVMLECNCNPTLKPTIAHNASSATCTSGATWNGSPVGCTSSRAAYQTAGSGNKQQLLCSRCHEEVSSAPALASSASQSQSQSQPATLPLATTKHACPFHTALLCGPQLKRYMIPKSTPKSPQRLAMEQMGRNWPKFGSRGAKLPTIQSTSNVPSLEVSAASPAAAIAATATSSASLHQTEPFSESLLSHVSSAAVPSDKQLSRVNFTIHEATPVLSNLLPPNTAAPESSRPNTATFARPSQAAGVGEHSCIIRLPLESEELADIDSEPDDAFAVAFSAENGGVRCSRQPRAELLPLESAGAAHGDRSARSSASDNFVHATGTCGALPTPEASPDPTAGADTGTHSAAQQPARADAIDSLLVEASLASPFANTLASAVRPTRSPRISQPPSEMGLTPRRHCDGCFQVCLKYSHSKKSIY